MTIHHGNNAPRAWRLILAKLHHDTHAEHLIHNEIGGCPSCWAESADTLAEIATTLLVSKAGATASRIAESEIDLALEAADRDRLGIPIDIEWVARCLNRPWLSE